jgi:uncharacterized membrane protein HdeD (DUF308 family)
MPSLELFLSGALCMGYAIAALFFLRFWRDNGDRLFAYFAAAFGLLVVQRLALALFPGTSDQTSWMYLLRLLAFVLIIIAVVDKNRAAR